MNIPDADQRSPAPDGRPAEDQPAWRDDFPIDWPQDQYVARREFTKFMVLTSLAFVAGQICIGNPSAIAARSFPYRLATSGPPSCSISSIDVSVDIGSTRSERHTTVGGAATMVMTTSTGR